MCVYVGCVCVGSVCVCVNSVMSMSRSMNVGCCSVCCSVISGSMSECLVLLLLSFRNVRFYA